MGWTESSGTVSRAFDEWLATDAEVRAFAKLALAWSERGYGELWADAGQIVNHAYEPDGYEQADAFHSSVDGLWPDEFEWVIRSTVIKEAVTAFEVYLEKSAQEALDRYEVTDEAGRTYRMRLWRPKTRQSPGYKELVGFHMMLRNNVDTDPVRYIRGLRHILTHQRGEIRSVEHRDRFADDHVIAYSTNPEEFEDLWDRAYVGGKVQLQQARVTRILDDLGAVVRAADPAVWAIAWDRAPLPDPMTLKTKRLIEFVPA